MQERHFPRADYLVAPEAGRHGRRPRGCRPAGTRLLADVADATGLTSGFADALAVAGRRAGGHDPGRVALDLAVTIADGGRAITDLGVLRAQPELFGPVASDPTAWRALELVELVDAAALGRLRAARAAARELAWAQLRETRGDLPASTAAGRDVPGLVLDIDATIVITHSEKEQASPTWKKTYGYYPLLCFLDNIREALAGLLRPGRAGSNTAADHITVLDLALAQIPDAHRHGIDILVRTDAAGRTTAFLHHVRDLREHGLSTHFPVGVPITAPIRDGLAHASAWIDALDTDGDLRDGAQVASRRRPRPGRLPARHPADRPTRTPAPRRATRPVRHRRRMAPPGHRHRHTRRRRTDPVPGSPSPRTRRVEGRIRWAKTTGLGRFPSRLFAINAAWLELALTGCDLLSWTQHLLLDGELARAEPRRPRYQLLHVAARITRGARRIKLRIHATWPWAAELATAFARLAALPRPAT